MGTAITDCRRQPGGLRRRYPRLRRGARQGGQAHHRAQRRAGRDRAGRHLRHQRPLLRRRHPPQRRRACDAGVRGRAADRLDGEYRPLERRRGHGARVDLERRHGDLPGGAAPAGCEAGLSRRADQVGDADHRGQQPASRLSAG